MASSRSALTSTLLREAFEVGWMLDVKHLNCASRSMASEIALKRRTPLDNKLWSAPNDAELPRLEKSGEMQHGKEWDHKCRDEHQGQSCHWAGGDVANQGTDFGERARRQGRR